MASFATSRRLSVLFVIVALGIIAFAFIGYTRAGVSKELGFYSLSPQGESTGRSVPASCPSNLHDSANYGQACAATNACSQTAYGVYQCGGSGTVCSVQPPALPDGYGSACQIVNVCSNAPGSTIPGLIGCDGHCHPRSDSGWTGFGSACTSGAQNACGMRSSGTQLCDGSCSAVSAPPDSLCAANTNAPSGCELHTTPGQVFKNARTILSWSSQNSDSCTITGRSAAGTVLQSIPGLAGVGSVVSDPLQEDADFSLTCTNAAGTCNANPSHVRVIGSMTWIEF